MIMSAVLRGVVAGFRPMEETDLPAVLEIENRVYEYPWAAGIFQDCLRMSYNCWVYEQKYDIVAYGIATIGAGESHLLNLSVHPDSQRAGLGRKMLNHLISMSQRHNVDTLLLEVRPSNHAALCLYRAAGFNEVGLRKNYYPAGRGREDALILACDIRYACV